DIKVYYTRLKDETVYLRPRVTLANDVKADMFISVHCNYYDRFWRYTVNGAETLYSSKNKNMKGKSKKLADIMLDNYTGGLSIRKRGVIDRKKELFILKKSRVPSTIVELGYMSDKNDLKCLTSSKKRKKIVDGLYNGIVEAYASMYGKTVSDGT
ncbi:MAG: N-acetylmuramoyl-L-alanine amidase, partial [Lachnospiraceae bacterium]|nr:N-acetylmuramoyl-L-alanine amidase [Lachnospiraceae bacterium]